MQQSISAVRNLSDFMHAIAPNSQDGRVFSSVLSAEFKIPQDDLLSLHHAYISILELFDEAIAEGDSIVNSSQKQLFLAPILEFQTQFKQQTIRSSANSFHISEPTLSKLKYAAEFINISLEQPVPEDTLTKLMQEAESMIKEIIESELPKYIKGRLIEVLENLRFAITTYRLRGISALRKTTEEMAGILVYNRAEITQTIDKNEKNKKTIFDLATFVSKASAVIELATKLKELAAPVIQFFLPGEQKS